LKRYRTLLVANLDVPAALNPPGDGGELLGNVAPAWGNHEDRARACLAHLPEEVLVDFFNLGQFLVN